MRRSLTFNKRVNIAIDIVQEKFPKAELYVVDGVSSIGSTTNPNEIDKLKLLFNTTTNAMVVIKEYEQGKFEDPIFNDNHVYSNRTIHWPVQMNLAKANQLKEKAGYINPYHAVSLRNHPSPARYNPYYIFSQDTESFVFVDTITGQVFSGG